MSKPQVIPATVKKVGRKTILDGTYKPGVKKGCWQQDNEEVKATLVEWYQSGMQNGCCQQDDGLREMKRHPPSRINYVENAGSKKVNISKDSTLSINEEVTDMMYKLLLQQSAPDIEIDLFGTLLCEKCPNTELLLVRIWTLFTQ